MMQGFMVSIALGIISMAVATPAAAQSFFACRGSDGQGWGLYRVDGNSIARWSPGTGWSGNLCGERLCSISPSEISMSWTTIPTRGAYAYTEQTETFTINRRSGTALRQFVSDQWNNNGGPYRPGNDRTYNPHREWQKSGSCSAASDPDAGPAKF